MTIILLIAIISGAICHTTESCYRDRPTCGDFVMLPKKRKIDYLFLFLWIIHKLVAFASYTHHRHRRGLSQADDALVRFLKGILKCFSHIKKKNVYTFLSFL